MLKVYAFLVKLPSLSDAQFFAHWRHPHGTLTRKIPQFRRYVQNHGIGPVPTVPGLAPTPYLGIPNIWVDDMEALAAANAHPDYAPLDADGDKMYDRSRITWAITEETVVQRPPQAAEAQPVKAILLLKQRGAALDADAMRSLAMRAGQALPALCGAVFALPVQPADIADAILELVFPDEQSFAASWRDGAFLKTVDEIADVGASHGFLAREERVIWPAADTPAVKSN